MKMYIRKLATTRYSVARGQSIVETALLSLFLALLLAAAVDFGRAFYIGTVIEQMAGEGAYYAAMFPERDIAAPSCSDSGVLPHNNIQDRARQVAVDRGAVIHQPARADVTVTHADRTPFPCTSRCAGLAIRVNVTYLIDDLFLPRLVGMSGIRITKSATQLILDHGEGTDCP